MSLPYGILRIRQRTRGLGSDEVNRKGVREIARRKGEQGMVATTEESDDVKVEPQFASHTPRRSCARAQVLYLSAVGTSLAASSTRYSADVQHGHLSSQDRIVD